MHQAQRGLEVGLVQVGVILAELVGEEHALVDDGAARQRHDVVVRQPPLALAVDGVGDDLAQDVELALELVLGLDRRATADDHLHVERLGRLHRLAERRVVVRHLAPAEQRQAFLRDFLRIGIENDLPPFGVVRHEHRADRVVAGLGQHDVELFGFADEELVRDLHQDARAVAGARIGADRAAMFEVAQDRNRVLDDLVRLAALDVGDEADAAAILVEAGIVEAVRFGDARPQRERDRGIFHGPLRRRRAHSHLAEPLRAHRLPRCPAALHRPPGAA
jgi:hypothetical protein